MRKYFNIFLMLLIITPIENDKLREKNKKEEIIKQTTYNVLF